MCIRDRLWAALRSQLGHHELYRPPELGPETPNLDLAFEALASTGTDGTTEVRDRVAGAVDFLVAETERLRSIAAVADRRAPDPGGVAVRVREAAEERLGSDTVDRVMGSLAVRAVRGGTRRALESVRRQTPVERRASKAVSAPGRGLAAAALSGELGQPVTVIMPIHNAAAETARAIEALTRFTTCLLYTSPSPRDATLSRMPSSA